MHKTTRIPFFPAATNHAISPIVCKSSSQTKSEKALTQTFRASIPPVHPSRLSSGRTSEWRLESRIQQYLDKQSRTVNNPTRIFIPE
ncbi:unnamed protein product, partial [Brenthis ino]